MAFFPSFSLSRNRCVCVHGLNRNSKSGSISWHLVWNGWWMDGQTFHMHPFMQPTTALLLRNRFKQCELNEQIKKRKEEKKRKEGRERLCDTTYLFRKWITVGNSPHNFVIYRFFSLIFRSPWISCDCRMAFAMPSGRCSRCCRRRSKRMGYGMVCILQQHRQCNWYICGVRNCHKKKMMYKSKMTIADKYAMSELYSLEWFHLLHIAVSSYTVGEWCVFYFSLLRHSAHRTHWLPLIAFEQCQHLHCQFRTRPIASFALR